MIRLLQSLVWLFGRLVLRLRYRIQLHGLDQLRGLEGPVLILPNHVGYIDPVIVQCLLGPRFHPRPLLFASNFHNPVLYPLMKVLEAVEVPDMDRPSKRARQQAAAAVAQIVAGLRAGRSHVLWPSGRAQRDGREVLGGARALTDILKGAPDATPVLVRTRGLWGGMYTFAQTGKPPAILGGALRGLGILLANLLIFTPRRRLVITVEKLDRGRIPLVPPETLAGLSPEARAAAELQERQAVNRWFEAWYNEDTGGEPKRETPTYRPYYFLAGRTEFAWPKPAQAAGEMLAQVTPETQTAVAEVLEQKLGRPLGADGKRPEVTLDALGLDSLDRMDLNHRIERRFGFSSDEVPTNLGQLWLVAQGLAPRRAGKAVPEAWRQAQATKAGTLAEILADTVPQAFAARALRDRRALAAADDIAGALTYERLFLGAWLLSRRLKDLPGTNVGLLMPASVGGDVAFLALHLAGKVPVVLNWTTGRANLGHAVRLLGLTHVVTAEAFFDRLAEDEEPPDVKLVYLEDLRLSVGKLEALRTLLAVRWFPGRIQAQIPRPDPSAPAAVLFTSGSEKAPKAVPLTHANVLTNERAALAALTVTRDDAVLGFLPAFHSFGLTITGLLPILAGVRVVRHPDPTDAGALARKLAGYRPTLMVGTPTFVAYILDRAERLLCDGLKAKGQAPADLAAYLRDHPEAAREGPLGSLRVIVVGAEKCPEAVFQRVALLAPQAELLEGYGITECSPVVSVNPPGATRRGTIGKPLNGVEVCVVDLEGGPNGFTDARRLGPDEQGMLLVAGPTVFPGYLGGDAPSPFVERDGRRWYVTGDLAKIDRDGYLHFAGRLKRFLKAGGEMISLPALEEPLVTRYPPDDQKGPRVAVEGVELDHGKPRLALFTTVPGLTLAEANRILEQAGFRGIMRLTEVQQVEAIPTLGTGKSDYKQLRARLVQGAASQT